MLEWPSCAWIALGWAPWAMSRAGHVWRRSWMRRPSGRPAAASDGRQIRERGEPGRLPGERKWGFHGESQALLLGRSANRSADGGGQNWPGKEVPSVAPGLTKV